MLTNSSLDLASCPECLLPAEIIDAFVLPTSDGPLPHVRTVGVAGHRFMLPSESLPVNPDG